MQLTLGGRGRNAILSKCVHASLGGVTDWWQSSLFQRIYCAHPAPSIYVGNQNFTESLFPLLVSAAKLLTKLS